MVHPFRQEFPEFEGDFMSPDIDEKVGTVVHLQVAWISLNWYCKFQGYSRRAS